ncbi:MAG: hypothetical protein JWO10_2203, partial [Microbacteriaceae bacterium]|nr:hypothetical protein [Microbacteriaceae bacterium]
MVLVFGMVGVTALPASAGDAGWVSLGQKLTGPGGSFGSPVNANGDVGDSTILMGASSTLGLTGNPAGSITLAAAAPIINIPT